MLTERQREAVARWYARPEVLEKASELYDEQAYEELEGFMHKTCLMPLGRHDELPDYMRGENGEPLFEHDLNPSGDEAVWQDAIEIGWEVVRRVLGFSHDDVHRAIAAQQKDDWQAFLESVEQRKRERDE